MVCACCISAMASVCQVTTILIYDGAGCWLNDGGTKIRNCNFIRQPKHNQSKITGMKRWKWLLPIALMLVAGMPADEPKEILLWPNGAPGSEGKTGAEKVRISEEGDHVISGIHHPSVTPYLPAAGRSTGAAI